MVKNLPTVERSTKIRFGKNCTDDQAENTIVFNASDEQLDIPFSDSVYMTPLRLRTDLSDRKITVLAYNQVTKEVMDSGAVAEDILNFSLEAAVINGNVTGNTVSFNDAVTSVTTLSNVGVANGNPVHTLDVGSTFNVDTEGSNLLTVLGNTYMQNNLVVDGNMRVNGALTTVNTVNTIVKDPIIELGKENVSSDLGIIMYRPNANVAVGFREGPDELVFAYTDSSSYGSTIIPKTSDSLDVRVYGRVLTESNVGILTTTPTHSLDVGSNLFVDEFGSNVLYVTGNTHTTDILSIGNKVGIKETDPDAELHVEGNVYVSSNLTVDENTFHVDATAHAVGIETKEPDANLHVVGNVYVSSNLTVDENTFHVDSTAHAVGIETKEPDANLHVVGNVYTSGDLTVDENTFHVDATAHAVGIETKEPHANLHVVGNVYTSGDLTVDENTFHVDAEYNSVGVGTKEPDANLHVVGNVYVTSDLTVDENTFHVDAVNHAVGIETKSPDANLHVVGNVYVTDDLTVATDALHVEASTERVGIKTKSPDAELHVVGNVYVATEFTVDDDTFHVDAVNHAVGIETKSPDANLHVVGNVYVSDDLTVATDALHVEASTERVGIKTKSPDAELHVVGNVYTSGDLTVDENTFHVDVEYKSIGLGTVNPNANLHVIGNVYTSGDLTVDENTFHVDAVNHAVGIETKEPDANLHVVGNVYVSDDLTVATDALHVEASTQSVGVGIKVPDAKLHVAGNVYVSDDLTVDENTFHVDAGRHAVGIETKEPDANLHVVGNVYVSGDLTVDENTFHIDAANHAVGIETKSPDANLHVVGNVYISSNLTVDTDTLHVDAETSRVGLGTKAPAYLLDVHGTSNVGALTAVSGRVATDLIVDQHIGINTLTPSTELHIEGNAYVSSNIQASAYFGDGGLLSNVNLQVVSDHGNATSNTIQFTNPTTALATDLTSNVDVKLDQLSNVSITDLAADQILVYDDSGKWVNEFPLHNYIKIRNAENGITMLAGNTVYIDSFHNQNVVNVKLAKANSPSTMPSIGIVYDASLAPGVEGVAVAYGKVNQMDTLSFNEGETLYVSNTYAGVLSNVKPYGTDPDLIQNIGVVTRKDNHSGAIFVTGVGRANDIPNAPIVADETDINYVYVNNENNDLKKILPTNLLTQLQTFEQVSAAGNTVSNVMEFNNVTTGLVTVANVEVGSNISVVGLSDPNNKYLPMVGTDGFFEKSPVYVTDTGKYVISASEAEFLGNITLSGNTTILSSESVTISDRIFGVGANNSATGLDSGFMIEHQHGVGDYANVALIHHAVDHRFAIGYTQNTFSDDHILYYQYPNRNLLLDIQGNLLVQNALTVTQTSAFGGAATFANDLTVGAASNLFVDVSTSRVGINEASPSTSLDVGGDVNIQSVVSATSKTSGALVVAGGVGVGGDVYASNAVLSGDFTVDTDTLIVNSTTDRVNIKALDVAGDAIVADDFTVDTNTLHVDSVTDRVGVGTLGPDAKLHVVGNAYVSSDVTVDGTTFHVDAGTHSIGVGTVTPEANLHVAGNAYILNEITMNSTVDVQDATEAFSTTTGAVTIAGGLGVVGNVHAAQYHGDGSKLRGLVTTLEDVADNGNTMSNTIQFTNTTTSFVTEGNVGISNTAPEHDLSIGSNLFVEDVGSNVIHATGNIYATRFIGDGSFLENIASSLQQITDNGSETTNTVEFQNTGTSLITFGNVGVANTTPGHDLSVGSNLFVEDVGSNVVHVTGNIYATRFIGDGSFLENIASSLQQITDNGNVTSNTVIFENETTGLVTDGKVGVSTRSPDANLHVVGNVYMSDVVTLASGLVTNRDQVSKKTYAYSGTITSGTQPYINVNFTSDIFYSKISAQLVDGNEELSTAILEVSGGSKNGATPTKNISFGTKNVFGDPDNPNPWNEDMITTGNRVALRPLGTLSTTGEYHLFIEYTSPSADGGVTTIDKDTTSEITFGY
jgi:hypothetical protein